MATMFAPNQILKTAAPDFTGSRSHHGRTPLPARPRRRSEAQPCPITPTSLDGQERRAAVREALARTSSPSNSPSSSSAADRSSSKAPSACASRSRTSRAISTLGQRHRRARLPAKDRRRPRQWSRVPVINALSDLYHPCQALADMQTIREHFGDAAAGSSWPSSATATTSRSR